jgi:hypothetical protein
MLKLYRQIELCNHIYEQINIFDAVEIIENHKKLWNTLQEYKECDMISCISYISTKIYKNLVIKVCMDLDDINDLHLSLVEVDENEFETDYFLNLKKDVDSIKLLVENIKSDSDSIPLWNKNDNKYMEEHLPIYARN